MNMSMKAFHVETRSSGGFAWPQLVCCALDATGTPLRVAVWLDDRVVGSHCGGMTGVDRGCGPEGSERVFL
jgi:hypothetical protein